MSMQVGTNRSSVCSVEFDPDYLHDQQSRLWPEKGAATLDPVANPADFFCPGTAPGDRGFTPVPEYLLRPKPSFQTYVVDGTFKFVKAMAAFTIAGAAGGAVYSVGVVVDAFASDTPHMNPRNALLNTLSAVGGAGLAAATAACGGAALTGGAIIVAGVGVAGVVHLTTSQPNTSVSCGLTALVGAALSAIVGAAARGAANVGVVARGAANVGVSVAAVGGVVGFSAAAAVGIVDGYMPGRSGSAVGLALAAASGIVGVAAASGIVGVADFFAFITRADLGPVLSGSAHGTAFASLCAAAGGIGAGSAAITCILRSTLYVLGKVIEFKTRKSATGLLPREPGPSDTRWGGDRKGKGAVVAPTVSRISAVPSGGGSMAGGVIGVPFINNAGQGRAPVLAERVAAVVQGLTPAKIAEAEELVRFNDLHTLLQDNGVAGRSEIIKAFWEILENKDYKRYLREDFLRTRQSRTVERVEAWLLNGGAVVQFTGRNRDRTFKGVCHLLAKYLQLSEEMRARVVHHQ